MSQGTRLCEQLVELLDALEIISERTEALQHHVNVNNMDACLDNFYACMERAVGSDALELAKLERFERRQRNSA